MQAQLSPENSNTVLLSSSNLNGFCRKVNCYFTFLSCSAQTEGFQHINQANVRKNRLNQQFEIFTEPTFYSEPQLLV